MLFYYGSLSRPIHLSIKPKKIINSSFPTNHIILGPTLIFSQLKFQNMYLETSSRFNSVEGLDNGSDSLFTCETQSDDGNTIFRPAKAIIEIRQTLQGPSERKIKEAALLHPNCTSDQILVKELLSLSFWLSLTWHWHQNHGSWASLSFLSIIPLIR